MTTTTATNSPSMGRNNAGQGNKPDSFGTFREWAFAAIIASLVGWIFTQVQKDSAEISKHTAKIEDISKGVDGIRTDIRDLRNDIKRHPNQ